MTNSPLIQPSLLRDHLDDPEWVVFDCRHELSNPEYGEKAYAESHIPGARFAHLDKNLSSPPSAEKGRHPLPDEKSFTHWLGQQGVSPQSTVVAYDNQGMFAARLWWLLRALGHKNTVVLDGGFRGWMKGSHPTTSEFPRLSPGHYQGTFNPEHMIPFEDLASHYNSGELLLIDARGSGRYLGESEPLDKAAGHIPGAHNFPFPGNMDGEGKFRDQGFLKDRFNSVSENFNPENIIHYCGSGVSACHNMLAMAVAGLSPGRLYVGSWSQWSADPDRPVETTPNP